MIKTRIDYKSENFIISVTRRGFVIYVNITTKCCAHVDDFTADRNSLKEIKGLVATIRAYCNPTLSIDDRMVLADEILKLEQL